MKMMYMLLLLLMLPIASAETGIVLNASGYVQYKYDTDTRPSLQSGEYIVVYEDINSILRDAKYDGTKFVNPEKPVELEEIELQATPSKIDPTQTIISGLTAGGVAYLVAKRRKP